MDEILEQLPPGSLVLDLGSMGGSFADDATRARAIRVDLSVPRTLPRLFVQADAARLPFRPRTFDAIVLNHSVEHFAQLKPCLQELGRVIKADGAAYIAVPDATTLSDRVYRKLYRNAGGHVNLFDSPEKLAAMLSWYLGLPHVATRTLLTSFNFMNRSHNAANIPQMRFGGFPEPVLCAITFGARLVDRWFGARAGVYGWAFFFGAIPLKIATTVFDNVCVRCGQGRPVSELTRDRFLPLYRCPGCGARNVLVVR